MLLISKNANIKHQNLHDFRKLQSNPPNLPNAFTRH